jgi:hypothetical protein
MHRAYPRFILFIRHHSMEYNIIDFLSCAIQETVIGAGRYRVYDKTHFWLVCSREYSIEVYGILVLATVFGDGNK